MITKISNNQKSTQGELNLLLLFSGNITITTEGSEHTIRKQQFIIYGTPFEITTASPYLDGFMISLSGEIDDKLAQTYSMLQEKIGSYTPLRIKDPQAKKELLSSMYKAKNDESLLASYLHILLVTLTEGVDEHQQKSSVFEQFCNLIDENISNNYCAGEYAEMMDIPIRELIYQVRKEADQTPCNVITGRVITQAKDLLINSSDSSKVIAYQLGFEDPYYFIKYFKKNVGCTPTQFRKNQLMEVS